MGKLVIAALTLAATVAAVGNVDTSVAGFGSVEHTRAGLNDKLH